MCRIRDPKEIRTHIPIQIYGRMVRINAGTGDIIRNQYNNSLSEYLKNYPNDYNVSLETVVETIKVANTFEIKLLSREMMMNIRKEILAECRFIRTFKIDENIHSFYNCKDKQYFGLIGIGIVSDKSGNQIYSILNKELFIN